MSRLGGSLTGCRIHSAYSVEVLEKLPQVTIVHHIEPDGTVWASYKRRVLRKTKNNWRPVSKFPFSAPRDFFGFSRPTARVMRADKCNLYVNNAGFILGIRGGRVYAFRKDLRPYPLFQIQGDCVLHRGICEDRNGWSYFGEYFMNPDRDPVRIWRVSTELDSWEIAHEFNAGSIRHIHGVYKDTFDRETMWVTVGDYAGECYFFKTVDGFHSMERYGDGTQIWRAVNLFFTPDYVCWLTDSHLDQNYACRMDRSTGQLQLGQKIDCSTWYGATTHEGLHIAFTTVEHGPAILRQESSLLISSDAFHWKEIYNFQKDFYRPIKLFKSGVICCPSGILSAKNFYISGEGLVGLDGCSLCLRIEPKANNI
jgi:hypothetical protein